MARRDHRPSRSDEVTTIDAAELKSTSTSPHERQHADSQDLMLRAENLSKVYRTSGHREVVALEDVSIVVHRGECVALAGPSGSGKSTLLSLAGALERPTSGRVLIGNEDLSGYSDVQLARVRRRIGFLFQDFGLIRQLTAWENITYPLIPRGWAVAARQDRAKALLEQVGLPDKFHQTPSELSGGEQQRVALARALAGDPQLLLLDEPTSNLDAAAGRRLIEQLQTLQSSGLTIVLASHDPALLACSGRCYELSQGRLV